MMADVLTSDDFSILNKDNKAVIYITQDPTLNLMTFKIINASTGGPLKLSGGKPVIKGPGGSSFNFNFETILAPEVVKGLNLILPTDWAAAFFPGDQVSPPSWSIAPVNNVVLNLNDEISIIIKNIICSTTHPGN